MEKYRLGNECDTYVEMRLENTFQTDSSLPSFSSIITLSLGSNGERDFESTSAEVKPDLSTNTSLNLALREAYVISDNIGPLGSSLWVGKR